MDPLLKFVLESLHSFGPPYLNWNPIVVNCTPVTKSSVTEVTLAIKIQVPSLFLHLCIHPYNPLCLQDFFNNFQKLSKHHLSMVVYVGIVSNFILEVKISVG